MVIMTLDNCLYDIYNDAQEDPCPLICPDNINELYSGNTCFKILSLNIRSLSKHYEELSNLISSLSFTFSCIILTETFQNEDKKSLYSLTGYDSFEIYRGKKKGGGVSVFIKEEFKAKQFYSIVSSDIEAIGVTLIDGVRNISLIGLYRPPQGSRLNFIHSLDNLFNTKIKNELCIVAGDFNIDVSKGNTVSYCKDRFCNTMTSNGFTNLITNTTRPNTNNDYNSTIIDHIWINKHETTKTFTLCTDISDHYPCILTIESLTSPPLLREISYRPVSDKRKHSFINNLRTSDFSFIHDDTISIDTKFQRFSDIFYTLFDAHFPIKYKTISEKRIKNKWLSKALLTSIRQKHKLLKHVRKGDIPLQTYTRYSALLTKVIRNAKSTYYKSKLTQGQDVRLTWNVINDILHRKKIKKNLIDKLVINDKVLTNKQEIAEELNTYFTTLGSNISNQIPPAQKSFLEYIKHNNGDKFFFNDVSNEEVKCIIKNLKNKSSDIYEIPNWVYKHCNSEISPVLAALYNLSLKHGVFPSTLKTARVTPIPKTKDTTIPQNFRPISILHTIGKILEKIVHLQLTDYLHENELLSRTQFGFTKNRNTEDALIYITEHIYKALNAKHTCVLLLLDFSKAFDVVPHNQLLEKLDTMGLSEMSLKWFTSYLSNRAQYVRLGDASSSPKTISHGVPQGSILGPLLFNLYTNDFSKCHNSIHSQYADDTAILITDNNITSLNNRVNAELRNVIDWVEANKLSLNLQKTHYLIITNLKKPVKLKIIARDSDIKQTSTAKLLGVMFDDKLSFKGHINNVVTKLSSATYALLKLKPAVPKFVLKQLYYSLVYPNLLYGISIWGCAKKSHLQPLIVVHKKIIRILSGTRNFIEHTNPLFARMSLLKIRDLHALAVTSHIFRVQNGLSSSLLTSLLTSHQTSNERALRSTQSGNLSKSNYTLTKSRGSISYHGIELWNNVPTDIRSSTSSHSFRKKYKLQLLSAY